MLAVIKLVTAKAAICLCNCNLASCLAKLAEQVEVDEAMEVACYLHSKTKASGHAAALLRTKSKSSGSRVTVSGVVSDRSIDNHISRPCLKITCCKGGLKGWRSGTGWSSRNGHGEGWLGKLR